MARIRSIKPEIRTSPTVTRWAREVRYAWVLLWGYLDDQGRGMDDARVIAADLFPTDKDVTDKKMARWLDLMADCGDPVICRYEVGGRTYLHAIKWTAHQKINRPTPPRIPPCPTHEYDVIHSVSHSLNGSVSDSLRARKEQGAGSRELEKNPQPHSDERGACDPQNPKHLGCRGCKTNRRAVNTLARQAQLVERCKTHSLVAPCISCAADRKAAG